MVGSRRHLASLYHCLGSNAYSSTVHNYLYMHSLVLDSFVMHVHYQEIFLIWYLALYNVAY